MQYIWWTRVRLRCADWVLQTKCFQITQIPKWNLLVIRTLRPFSANEMLTLWQRRSGKRCALSCDSQRTVYYKIKGVQRQALWQISIFVSCNNIWVSDRELNVPVWHLSPWQSHVPHLYIVACMLSVLVLHLFSSNWDTPVCCSETAQHVTATQPTQTRHTTQVTGSIK